jgi:hypothetical protein
LVELKIKEDKPEDNDLLKGAPPCLRMLAQEGIPNGQRNNAMYNFGVYVKKDFLIIGILKYLIIMISIANHL